MSGYDPVSGHNRETCPDTHCADCDDCRQPLLLVSADLGHGAFLSILCETCWHRRKYRAQLLELADRSGLGLAP